ncbi:MAG: DUF4760 domain-containing protein [Deltaproteobacteria bacterium]|nr:DUF4760 domain-containing protein [Deltaproteobacteria bacterium]
MDWTAVGSIATAIGLALLAYQIFLQRRDSAFERATHIFAELNAPEVREALRFIYSRSPAELLLSELSDLRRQKVEMVLAHLERLSYRIRRGLVAEEEVYEMFWDVVVRVAQQLHSHIDDQAQRRGGYRHVANFEWLAKRFKVQSLKTDGGAPLNAYATPLPELLKMKPLPVFRVEPKSDEISQQE